MTLPLKPTFPWLLYSYPWMPFPRRVSIYLREKGISEELVQVVHVLAPNEGNKIVYPEDAPPKPAGSLPILAISSDDGSMSRLYIRQSTAIINFLEELCNTNQFGFSSPYGSMFGDNLLKRTRYMEVLGLAEELTVGWNSVRMFGTKAGTMEYPEGAKEMLRWEKRALLTLETWWKDRDMSLLRKGSNGHVSIADVVLYQFHEFTEDCYNVDMTIGSGGKVEDVYGREVEEKFPKLVEFYDAFKTRDSARRDPGRGEVPSTFAKHRMSTWVDGVF